MQFLFKIKIIFTVIIHHADFEKIKDLMGRMETINVTEENMDKENNLTLLDKICTNIYIYDNIPFSLTSFYLNKKLTKEKKGKSSKLKRIKIAKCYRKCKTKEFFKCCKDENISIDCFEFYGDTEEELENFIDPNNFTPSLQTLCYGFRANHSISLQTLK